jgi:hypothetical protein
MLRRTRALMCEIVGHAGGNRDTNSWVWRISEKGKKVAPSPSAPTSDLGLSPTLGFSGTQ